mgnify:CR=1 FL=1
MTVHLNVEPRINAIIVNGWSLTQPVSGPSMVASHDDLINNEVGGVIVLPSDLVIIALQPNLSLSEKYRPDLAQDKSRTSFRIQAASLLVF